MNLSRSESRRRLQPWSRGRIGFVGALLLVLVVSIFVVYVRSMDAGYREEEGRAIAVAKSEGGLAEIEETVLHTWVEPIWIVRGKDKEGQEWIVWERKDGIVKEKAEDGLDEKRVRARFDSDRPDADVIRVLPGWFMDRPVWEIRYKKIPKSQLQSIDFYSFKEGTLLKTYDLPGY